jgi:amino acid transporter
MRSSKHDITELIRDTSTLQLTVLIMLFSGILGLVGLAILSAPGIWGLVAAVFLLAYCVAVFLKHWVD